MNWKPDICIYHFPCDDGFASAFAVWKKWGDTVEYAPTNYGQDFDFERCAGKDVLIADFSFDYETCCALSFKAKSVVILDHHKTAQAALDRLPPLARLTPKHLDEAFKINWTQNTPEICAHFDMERSGAALTWEFVHGADESAPYMIQRIEDRDLWRFQYPDTRAFTLWLRSFPYEFEIWDQIYQKDFETLAAEASAIERFYDRKLDDMEPTATIQTVAGHDGVPVAHAPYAFASDLAHRLLKAHPKAPFAAVVVDAYGNQTYSLRSEDSRVDVSEVAKSMGGGGHRNAAGFRVLI